MRVARLLSYIKALFRRGRMEDDLSDELQFHLQNEIEKSIEQALSGIDLLLEGDMERATMKINARPPRPKPEKPQKTETPGADDGSEPAPAAKTGTK